MSSVSVAKNRGALEAGSTLRERIGRSTQALSDSWARVERVLVTGFVGAIFLLILLNIVTRAINRPVIWVDELSIYLMVMTCFVGTSLTVRQRLDFAMTLVLDYLTPARLAVARRMLSLVGLAYAVFILWCSWRLFDPLDMVRSGFDVAKFTSLTMNFLYSEPTQTLGIPKWFVYLVMPVYGLGLTIHSLANLAEDLGWAQAAKAPEDEDIVVEAG
ncbi:TRAP transporter small permease [Ramlibacter sp.]|uniref:TRAP transporter small permease n=1 Tax=Ramlibacter sp. TaxID=1917967 RepID=UPI0017EA78B3|nr:TRAP transporter small permease [Ramlibacter sp.]MBA2676180.1 TRAP transporter small permease subunit [Ramlibacter sp.]